MDIESQKVFFKSSEDMSELKDGSIDVIVTSPPYNRGKEYSSDSGDMHNDNLPEEEYFAFLKRVWKECFRVASEKCVFFLNVGDSANDQGKSEKVSASAENVGWIRIQDIAWVKSIYGRGHYTPSGGDKRFNNIWEHVFMLVKNRTEYSLDTKSIGIPYADKANILRYGCDDIRDAGNVFHVCYDKTTGATIKKGHDAPFPIGLPYSCIKVVKNAKTILDPFLGIGTTLSASYSLGLKGFGYEKYPRKENIRETILSGKNYVPKPIILIPHYEGSIELLVKIIEDNGFTFNASNSKKEEEKYSILIDTLQKLGIGKKITGNLSNRYLNLDYWKSKK